MNTPDPDRRPRLNVRPARGETVAVALVLPGGRENSYAPAQARQLAALRMRPFAAALHQRGARQGLTVWQLGYRYRGWNGSEMSPVADARWALDEVRRRHSDVPVVLIGHSMGGRTVIRVAGDPAVVGVVAMAPWLPANDPVDQLRGRRLLIAHGDRDRVTSPRASREFAQRAAVVAAESAHVIVRRDTHAMLLRWPVWQQLATAPALAVLGLEPMSSRINRWLARGFA